MKTALPHVQNKQVLVYSSQLQFECSFFNKLGSAQVFLRQLNNYATLMGIGGGGINSQHHGCLAVLK